MWIPGYGSDEIRPFKKACTTEAHKQVGNQRLCVCVCSVQLPLSNVNNSFGLLAENGADPQDNQKVARLPRRTRRVRRLSFGVDSFFLD